MKLSILIVNWNTRDLVIKCINSILGNFPPFDYEILVVDNHSQDGSADTLINLFGHHKRIHVFPSLRNLGFAKGVNLAYQNSTGEFILILNPDTEVLEDALAKLVRFLEGRPEVGIVGPKLLNPDGSLQPSVRRFPGIWSSVIVFSGLHRFIRPRRYLMDDFTYRMTQEVDQVMGAALLTRRQIIETLGFLDENFWLWYEEVDFCKRVKEEGFQVMFYPEAEILHHGGQAFYQMEVYQRKKTVARSLIYYFRKNGNFLDVLAIQIALPLVLFVAKLLDYLQKIFKFKFKPRSQL